MKIFILVALFLLSACAGTSEPSRFYILSTPPNLDSEKISKSLASGIRLAVGPVKLSSYLKRPQMLTKTSENRISLAEFDRWAEPLAENVTEVLAENLSILLSSNDVVLYPWNRVIPIDYQVSVELVKFEASFDGKSYLVARWKLFGKSGKEFLFSRRSSFETVVQGRSFEAGAVSLSKNLAELSKEIATALSALVK
jgi:hypothetical protein